MWTLIVVLLLALAAFLLYKTKDTRVSEIVIDILLFTWLWEVMSDAC